MSLALDPQQIVILTTATFTTLAFISLMILNRILTRNDTNATRSNSRKP